MKNNKYTRNEVKKAKTVKEGKKIFLIRDEYFEYFIDDFNYSIFSSRYIEPERAKKVDKIAGQLPMISGALTSGGAVLTHQIMPYSTVATRTALIIITIIITSILTFCFMKYLKMDEWRDQTRVYEQVIVEERYVIEKTVKGLRVFCVFLIVLLAALAILSYLFITTSGFTYLTLFSIAVFLFLLLSPWLKSAFLRQKLLREKRIKGK
ncbi:hypothetical protein ACWOAN_00625 [Lactococcus taiwanensis]|uniref:hypothetical protein n=1 Tax=Lactococcus taiwanensis TaxID=1151742 RepID=UPI001907144D|nr:hypothetical protein [Lactococcus taiwanensis]